MAQLTEDEWSSKDEPTTTETEHLKGEPELPERSGVRSDYPPKLPLEATPTKD